MRSFKHFLCDTWQQTFDGRNLNNCFLSRRAEPQRSPVSSSKSDSTDMDALTPNHFLLGSAGLSLPSHSNCDFDHRKRYARAQAYSDAICSTWLKAYVPTLNRRAKWSTQSDKQLKTGDLVWIVEATSPRGYYRR